jgi:hypothetical protein
VNGKVGEEEKLAREALVQIRVWLEKQREIRGDPKPRLATKFCGGCNPCIERGVVARLIREDLAERVRWVSPDEEADLLLLIGGCLTACVDREEIKRKAARYLCISGSTVSLIRSEEGGEKISTGN